MISQFNDLSDKIDRLAELTQSLRRENATLRQSNVLLAAENGAFMERLSVAQRRVEALIAIIPPEPDDQKDAPEDAADFDANIDVDSDADVDAVVTYAKDAKDATITDEAAQ